MEPNPLLPLEVFPAAWLRERLRQHLIAEAKRLNWELEQRYYLVFESWLANKPVRDFLGQSWPAPMVPLAWRLEELGDLRLRLVEGPELVAAARQAPVTELIVKIGGLIPGTTSRYQVLPGDNAPIGYRTPDGKVKRFEFVFVFYEQT